MLDYKDIVNIDFFWWWKNTYSNTKLDVVINNLFGKRITEYNS